MSEKNDAMEAFLQEFEGKRDGSLVTGFVVIAELVNPADPDGAHTYSYFDKGSPALLLGLSDQLGWHIRDDIVDRSE